MPVAVPQPTGSNAFKEHQREYLSLQKDSQHYWPKLSRQNNPRPLQIFRFWKILENHLKKHGNDVTTVILKECQDQDELKKWGIYYSELWDIVESNDWANVRPENGDGGDTSLTPNYLKNKHRFSHSGESNPNYKHGNATKEAIKSRKHPNGQKHWLGKKRPFANRAYDFDGDKNPNAKQVMTPNGKFGSLKTAAEGNGLSLKQLYHRLEKHPMEFYRIK